MLKIGLDMDEVLDDFIHPYLNRFGEPKTSHEITKNVTKILSKDKEFWLNLPVLHRINFIPTLYCSKRVNPKSWSKQWLSDNNFPNSPFYQMYCQNGNKANMIKGRVDVFIDDSVNNFKKINGSGVPCLLLDNETNRKAGPFCRIYSLDREEIEFTYNLAIKTGIFKNFKKYLDEIDCYY